MSSLLGAAVGVCCGLLHDAWVRTSVQRHLAGGARGWGASGRVLTIATLLFAMAWLSGPGVAVALLAFAATRVFLTAREGLR